MHIESLKGPLLGEEYLLNLLVHYPCYKRTINSARSLLGDCASSTDHVVIYDAVLQRDNELKMLSRPKPDQAHLLPTGSEGEVLGVSEEYFCNASLSLRYKNFCIVIALTFFFFFWIGFYLG